MARANPQADRLVGVLVVAAALGCPLHELAAAVIPLLVVAMGRAPQEGK